MRVMRLVIGGSLLLSAQMLAFGSEQQPLSQEQRVAARIAEVSKRLAPESVGQLSAHDAKAQRAAVTNAIREEVTKYVESYIGPSQDRKTVLPRLREVLINHQPDLDLAGPPAMADGDLRFGQSLVLSYTVVRPPHFDEGLLFGFRANAGRYRLVSTAGEEFQSYTMTTNLLPSPSPGELWFLAMGQAHTFNGAKIRFRVYSFDGQDFTTIWTPEDLQGADVTITSTGFAIRHIPWQGNRYETEEYTVSPGAVLRVK